MVLSDLSADNSTYLKINLEQDPTVDYNLMQDKDGKDMNL